MKFFLIFIMLLVFVSCATFKDEVVQEAVEVNNHEGKFAYLIGGEVVRTDKVYRVGDTLK